MNKYFNDVMKKFFNKKPKIHFIGIGGIGMSAIAGICLSYGFSVTGSDIADNMNIQNLIKRGAKINLFHSEKNIGDCDIVIYSSAIKFDNPEFTQAIKSNKCVLERHKFLGMLFNCFEKSIAVSGCHGKTTTCGFLSQILVEANADPQILIGGNLALIGGNYRSGNGCCLAEACEYKRNFLSLKPLIPVVLNIDNDHMDYFKDINDLANAYDTFLSNMKENGTAVICGDDGNCALLKNRDKCITFGFSENNTCFAKNVRKYRGKYSFTLCYKGEEYRVRLNIFGRQNISNALAAFCAARLIGIEGGAIVKALSNYRGIRRRFEYVGKSGGADVITDYAHHPFEIETVLKCARDIYKGRITAVFQPHTYSRTKTLMADFVKCFDLCDTLILLPVYSARESFDKEGSTAALYENITKRKKGVVMLETFNDTENYLRQNKQDAVLFIGAGDIDRLAEKLIG